MKRAETETEKERILEEAERTTTRVTRILLAEDDTEMRCLLAWRLEADSYEVITAEDGLELHKQLAPALAGSRKQAGEPEFDLIISDIRMPGFSGLEVLASLRRQDRTTPVILITAFGDDETRDTALCLGASTVIDKPFDVDDLCAVARRIMPPRWNEGAGRDPA